MENQVNCLTPEEEYFLMSIKSINELKTDVDVARFNSITAKVILRATELTAPCIDCGNEPKPTAKALFFDLDYSLIRPKMQESSIEVQRIFNAGTRRIMADTRIKRPKYLSEENYFELTSDNSEMVKIGFSYRPTFPVDNKDWEFIPGVCEAIRPFIANDYLFVIISNQGGIESGFQTVEETEEKISSVLFGLSATAGNGNIDKLSYFYCPSLKPCFDRKPQPGMILRAAKKLNIDLEQSYFVGDMESDKVAAENAGIKNYFHIDSFLALNYLLNQ